MDPALRSQVNSIRLTLQALESQVGAGRLPQEALEDLKSAVDEIRLRMWAIMAASAAGSDGLALERFRLRRAIESCDNLSNEFDNGTISARHKECVTLLGSLDRLAKCVEKAVPEKH